MRTVHLEMENLSKHIVVIECRWLFSFYFPLDVRSSCGPAGDLGSLHPQPFVGDEQPGTSMLGFEVETNQ